MILCKEQGDGETQDSQASVDVDIMVTSIFKTDQVAICFNIVCHEQDTYRILNLKTVVFQQDKQALLYEEGTAEIQDSCRVYVEDRVRAFDKTNSRHYMLVVVRR